MTEVRTTSSTGGQKGTKLARFDLIPPGPLRELAEHYGRGARKYADNQWRKGYEWSKSIAALGRHFNDFMAGKDYDVCSNDPEGCSDVDADGQPYQSPEPDTCFNHTGSHHMAAAAWHAFLLLEFKDAYPEHDDRYKPDGPDPDFDLVADQILSEGPPTRQPGLSQRMGCAVKPVFDHRGPNDPPPTSAAAAQLRLDDILETRKRKPMEVHFHQGFTTPAMIQEQLDAIFNKKPRLPGIPTGM